MIGYPGKVKNVHTLWYPHEMSGKADVEEDFSNLLWYQMDTSEGNSGSPIYFKENGKNLIVAIHQGYSGKVYNLGINTQTEYFKKFFDLIKNEINYS